MAVGAAEPCARHRDPARAGEIVRGLAGAAVQRRRSRDKLEHTARLVQVADGLVAPLRLLRPLQGGAAFLALQGVHRVTGFLVYKAARRVGVVVRLAGHGQHRAGVYIHNDADTPLGNMMLGHGGGQRTFQPVLDLGIDRQGKRIAGHRIHKGLVVGGHVVAPCVFGGQDAPVLPCQLVIVAQLQPPQPCIVHIGKAEDAAHKIPLRVDALGVLPDLNALHTVVAAPIPDRIGHRLVHAAAQQAIVGGSPAEFCQCFGVVQLQNLAQCPCGRLHGFVRHLPRGGADRPAGLAGRKQRTVRSVDLSARGRQRGPAQLLVGGAQRIAAGVAQHQNKKPHSQPAQTPDRQHRRQQPRAQAHFCVQLRRDMTHNTSPLPHTISV